MVELLELEFAYLLIWLDLNLNLSLLLVDLVEFEFVFDYWLSWLNFDLYNRSALCSAPEPLWADVVPWKASPAQSFPGQLCDAGSKPLHCLKAMKPARVGPGTDHLP